jgi:hypothetical protein
MKKTLISILFCFGLFAVKHSHAQNINPATQVKWPTSCGTSGTVYSPSGNDCVNLAGLSSGPVIYPANCQGSNAPSWCGGTGLTADVYIRAACGQLPSTGGTINLAGLTGTIANSVPCSNPSKQVIMLQDPTSVLTITEDDGGVVFPLDNASMFLGQGVGQCQFTAGIHLASSANVAAIVAQAHNDGTQEAFTANGLCLWGAVTATVTKGIMWADRVFTNTSFNGNNVQICPTACVLVQDVGGSMTVNGNLLNALAGATTITDSTLIIQAVTAGNSVIEVAGNSIQGANGGAGHSEILVIGNGAGVVNEGIWIHNDYVERAPDSTASLVGIQVTDCQSCSIENVTGLGTAGGNDFINVAQTAGGRTQNVTITNVLEAADTNVLNDTLAGVVFPRALDVNLAHYVVNSGFSDLPCSPLGGPPGVPYMGQCWSDPTTYRTNINTQTGVQQGAWLSDVATAIQSLGPDVMAGQGSFSTGSGTFGTNFVGSGCLSAEGLTCTFLRDNSTAPPDGSTFSQKVTISANTDPSVGFNGIQYSPSVSFIAGHAYKVNFWAKSDGSFTGIPTFLLWNPVTPVTYCLSNASGAMTSTWTLYTLLCVPSASGSSFLSVSAETPLGATGAFWVGSFTFEPSQPLTPGSFVGAVSPYGVSNSVNGASIGVGAGAPTASCGTAPTGSGSLWLRTDGGATTTLYVCNGTTWTPK